MLAADALHVFIRARFASQSAGPSVGGFGIEPEGHTGVEYLEFVVLLCAVQQGIKAFSKTLPNTFAKAYSTARSAHRRSRITHSALCHNTTNASANVTALARMTGQESISSP